MQLVGKFPRLGRPFKEEFWKELVKKCGLLSYTKPTTDKVGNSSREAVQGVKLVGTGSEYIKAPEFANLSLTYIDATTNLEVTDSFDANGEFIIPTNGIKSLIVEIYELNLNMDNSYTTQFVASDNSEPIMAQGYLMSPSNIVEDVSVISLADENGMSISDGVNYFYDDSQVNLIPIGHAIPSNQINQLQAFDIAGSRGNVDNYGRIKINLVKCDLNGNLNINGLYIKLQDNYHHIAKYDDTNILIEADGSPKVLPIVDLQNNINNQFFANITNGELQSTSFYKESLSGDCLTKASKLLGINELLIDKNGEVVSDKNGEIVYVYE